MKEKKSNPFLFMNVLERKGQEEALYRSESQLNVILESIADCITIVNRDLSILWANGLAERSFGKSIVGKRCYEVLKKKTQPCDPAECSALKAFKDGCIHECEVKIGTKKNDFRYYLCSSNVAFRDQGGSPQAVIQIFRDISHLKQTESELRTIRNKLEMKVMERTSELISSNKMLHKEIFFRKEVEKALRESEERFKLQYKGLPLPTFTWQLIKDGSDFIFIDYNDAAFVSTDGKICTFLGTKARTFYHDVPEIVTDMQRCVAERSSFHREIFWKFRYINKKGYFLLTYAFVPPDLVIVHAEDITEKRLSERELKIKNSALSSSINAFAIIDLDGKVMYVNNSFLAMWGYNSLDELTGREITEFWQDRKRILTLFEKLKTEMKINSDLIGKRKDRSLFCVHLAANIINEPSAMYPCIMASFLDVTEQKQTQTKMGLMYKESQRSREDMLSILNNLRIGAVITDPLGRISFLNNAAQRLAGKSHEESIGMYWQELFHIKNNGTTHGKNSAWNGLDRGKKNNVNIETSDGRSFWMDIELHEDPNDMRRKIFFFYDMSEMYDLRRMLDERSQFHDLIGRTDQMKSVYQQIREVSSVDWTVLIEGETGTGKELVARAIHYSSPRKDMPFLAVNCAGLSDSLLTSQLFGHRKGSFTGAIEDHEGFFEAANGGTLFLDEIGDISMTLQTSLLRVLEEKEITRVGETKSRRVNVRIVVATNRTLLREIELGHFRSDLYYRIRVARISIPPLMNRREDIPLLVATFLRQCRASTGKMVHDISNEAINVLLGHPWPGNVRELKGAIEFAVMHCKKKIIQVEDLPPEIIDSSLSRPLHKEIKEDEKNRIILAIKNASGNRTLAARILGISRATLYRHLSNLNISAPEC